MRRLLVWDGVLPARRLRGRLQSPALHHLRVLTSHHCQFYPDQVNPFLQPIDEIKACEVKQYSRYEIDAAGKEEVLNPLQFTDKIPISQLLKKR